MNPWFMLGIIFVVLGMMNEATRMIWLPVGVYIIGMGLLFSSVSSDD